MLKTAALAGVMASTAVAFAPTAPTTRAALRPTVCGLSMEQNKQCVDLHCASRRLLLITALSAAVAAPAFAKGAINDCEAWTAGRKWLSGKSCQEKGSKETKGTKKDPQYLRKLQDCKAQGQAPGGKEEANNDINKACRDAVCTTYEQCTYQIGPKEDYGGFFF